MGFQLLGWESQVEKEEKKGQGGERKPPREATDHQHVVRRNGNRDIWLDVS